MIEEIVQLDDGRIKSGYRIWDLNNEEDRINFWWHKIVMQYGVGTGNWPIETQIEARLLEYPELKRELENDEYDWFDADPKRLLAHIDWWISCKLEAEYYDGPHWKLND